jgi:phosphatidylglycerol phospholipase C
LKDINLQRCFGVKKKVNECDWEYLETLRTVQAPHEPMPRLLDVLEYLRQPGREHIWVMLDIKVRLSYHAYLGTDTKRSLAHE